MTKPRKFVRMVQPRFVDDVRDGSKLCTIRKTPKRMPRVGDLISLRAWSGKPYRSKQIILKESVITAVSPISVSGMVGIRIGDEDIPEEDEDDFARHDGFKDFEDMRKWFYYTHGLPFKGILIQWKP